MGYRLEAGRCERENEPVPFFLSIEELKKKLSVILKQAAQGEVFHTTKHNKPVALLLGEGRVHLHRGVRCSGAKLAPLLHGATQGVYLEVLAQDRTESPLRPGL